MVLMKRKMKKKRRKKASLVNYSAPVAKCEDEKKNYSAEYNCRVEL